MGDRGPTAPAPTKPMDDKMFNQLVAMIRIQCTANEICSVLGMTDDTLNTRLKERGEPNFSELYEKHQGEGKASLRRMQWKNAEKGNPTMQIWLGKQVLDQKDKTEMTGAGGKDFIPAASVDVSQLSLAALGEIRKAMIDPDANSGD